MAVSIRPAVASDAEAVANMGREFVDYLRALGDAKAHSLTAEEYLRDGFGDDPAFTGLIAELDGDTVGYLLYTPGYDLDREAGSCPLLSCSCGHEHGGQAWGEHCSRQQPISVVGAAGHR